MDSCGTRSSEGAGLAEDVFRRQREAPRRGALGLGQRWRTGDDEVTTPYGRLPPTGGFGLSRPLSAAALQSKKPRNSLSEIAGRFERVPATFRFYADEVLRCGDGTT